jgi:hypothetical protein
VLPLSATTISPAMPPDCSAARAFSMHEASVSSSLRHGMTTESSTGEACPEAAARAASLAPELTAPPSRDAVRTETKIAGFL